MKHKARGEWKGKLELSDRITHIKCTIGAGGIPLAFLSRQFKLLKSVGVQLELIGCDVAKYGFKSTRMYFFFTFGQRSWNMEGSGFYHLQDNSNRQDEVSKVTHQQTISVHFYLTTRLGLP